MVLEWVHFITQKPRKSKVGGLAGSTCLCLDDLLIQSYFSRTLCNVFERREIATLCGISHHENKVLVAYNVEKFCRNGKIESFEICIIDR
jgi:hypothetical protein